MRAAQSIEIRFWSERVTSGCCELLRLVSTTVIKMSSGSLISLTKWFLDPWLFSPSPATWLSNMHTLKRFKLNTPGFTMAHLRTTCLISFVFKFLIICYVFPIHKKLSPSLTSVGLVSEVHSLSASTLQFITYSLLWIMFEILSANVTTAGLLLEKSWLTCF